LEHVERTLDFVEDLDPFAVAAGSEFVARDRSSG
jgi:hypothetical protein